MSGAIGTGSQKNNVLRLGRGTQFAIERSEGQAPPLREFQIRRIVQGQLVAFCEPRGRAPRLAIGFGIKGYGQQSKVGQRGIPKCRVMAPAPHTHFQNIGDFKPPQRRNPGPALNYKIKHVADCLGHFVAVNPSQSGRTVEDQGHGRPVSLSAFITSQSKPAGFRVCVRARMRSVATRA